MTQLQKSMVIIGLFAGFLLLVGTQPNPASIPPSNHARQPMIAFSGVISLADANASFFGENQFDQAGDQVASAGDVNGDGFEDILVSAPENGEGGFQAGKVYLILGNATISNGCAKDMNLSAADASFIGEKAGGGAGYSVAGAGDVNDDGFDDILIGALWKSPTGKAYLILGNASIGNGCAKNINLSAADASFIGEAAGGAAGSSVAGAGDVNGDGFDDILVGDFHNSEGGSTAGQAYLILGNATIGNGCAKNMNLSAADASFIGEAQDIQDFAGNAVAGAGDVNGDGFDDILVGALQNSEGGSQAGQAYLILGNATIGNGCAKDMHLGAADASFIGEATSDWAGASVAGAGDVNGDGFDDILVGALQNSEGGYHAGQAYLIRGNATIGNGCAKNMNLSAADASFIGNVEFSSIGNTVAGAGDVNRDGFDDILLGSGKNVSFLIWGNATIGNGCAKDMHTCAADASLTGVIADEGAGCCVAGVGDVNGDGLFDILVGADWSKAGGVSVGRAYLLIGWDEGRPTVTGPASKVYVEGTTGHVIQWALADVATNSPTYWVLRDGTEVVSPRAWPAGGVVTLFVDGLPAGIYSFTIYAADGNGNVGSATVTVTVTTNWLTVVTDVIGITLAGIGIMVLIVVTRRYKARAAGRNLPSSGPAQSENHHSISRS